MVTKFLSACAAAVVIVANLPGQDATQKELDKLQGKWTPVKLEIKGRDFTPKSGVVTYTISGSSYVAQLGDKDKALKRVLFIIDATKEPKIFDAKGTDGATRLGIYKLEADMLTICSATDGGPRPTEFKTTESFGDLTIWRRVSK